MATARCEGETKRAVLFSCFKTFCEDVCFRKIKVIIFIFIIQSGVCVRVVVI